MKTWQRTYIGGLYGILLTVMVAVAACGSGESPADPTDAPSGERVVDPYDVYVENNPAGERLISRENAQTRALLGCDMAFAPGTVDAVLQDAYQELCD